MANVEESSQFDYFMTAVRPFWNDPTVNTFEEAIESFVRSDSSSEKFEVLSGQEVDRLVLCGKMAIVRECGKVCKL